MSKKCCIKCFSVLEIKEFIGKFEECGNCDYCGSKNISLCEVSEVGEFILEGVLRKYEDPAENIAYESAEGGYQHPTKTIEEILIWEEFIFSDKIEDPSLLVKDLTTNYSIIDYVRKNPYG